MIKIPTKIAGCFQIEFSRYADNRGSLTKTFDKEMFLNQGLKYGWEDEYYSISHKNVIRGMHFQLPPYAHDKFVYCVSGQIVDVVVDLRKNSATYKQHIKIVLNGCDPAGIYIPEGCAHGLKSLQDNSIIICKTSRIYRSDCDRSISWDSCGIDWELIEPAIISDKDQQAIHLDDFASPF